MHKIYVTALALIGAILVYFAFHFYNLNREFRIYGIETEAIITRIEVTGSGENISRRVYIEYIINGQIYQNSLGMYHSGMREGQNIVIRVMPDNHLRIHYARFENLLPAILGSFGVFFIAGTFLQIVLGVIANERRKRVGNKNGKR